MSKMREAFEKWAVDNVGQPSFAGYHATLGKWVYHHNFMQKHSEAFEAGYQAAIADVKAGGPACWVHPTYLQGNALGIECSPVQFGPQQIPLYKLPEDV